MTIADAFDVAAPVERVWTLLRDVPRVARCIPNAELDEIVDERTYRARVAVKVGPVAVAYRATIVVAALDDATRTATIDVRGDESRGRGGVRARIVSRAEPRDGGTRVVLETDAQISGIVATVGGRLIEAVAKRTVAEFSACLATMLG